MAAVEGGLAVLGDLVEDVVVWLSGPAERGTDTAARIFRSRGGSAANVAAVAARLRARPGSSAGSARTRWATGWSRTSRRPASTCGSSAAGGPARWWCWSSRAGSARCCRTARPPRSSGRRPDDLAGVALVHVPAYGLDGGSTSDVLGDLLAHPAGG